MMFRIFKKHFSTNIPKVTKVNYMDILKNSNSKMSEIIDKAFGFNSLGILIVENIPGLLESKSKLHKQTFIMSNMDEKDSKNFCSPEKEQIGWRKKSVFFNNIENKYYGVFSAHGNSDTIHYPSNPSEEQKYRNIWPDNIPKFKDNFVSLSSLLGTFQIEVLRHIDEYIDNINSIERTSKDSSSHLYQTFVNNHVLFSQSICNYPNLKDGKVLSIHRDTGFISALTHPSYFNSSSEIIKAESGLNVKDRNGNFCEIEYEDDQMVLLIGEFVHLFSGGKLLATPHEITIKEKYRNLQRINFGQFLDPLYDYKIILPKNVNFNQVQASDPFQEFNLIDVEQGQDYKSYIDKVQEHTNRYSNKN